MGRRVPVSKKKMQIKSKITSLFELPTEVMLNLPLISITGSELVTIENYKGVIEYSEERVRINTSSGILKIEGKSLTLKQITAEEITVKGIVTKLEYLL